MRFANSVTDNIIKLLTVVAITFGCGGEKEEEKVELTMENKFDGIYGKTTCDDLEATASLTGDGIFKSIFYQIQDGRIEMGESHYSGNPCLKEYFGTMHNISSYEVLEDNDLSSDLIKIKINPFEKFTYGVQWDADDKYQGNDISCHRSRGEEYESEECQPYTVDRYLIFKLTDKGLHIPKIIKDGATSEEEMKEQEYAPEILELIDSLD